MDERVKYLQAIPRDSSYLQPRDPSIVSGYVATTKITNKNIRQRNLLPLLNKVETQSDSSMENVTTNATTDDKKQFKVYLRIKPTENGIDNKLYKIDPHKNELLSQIPTNLNGRNGRKNDETIIKKYKFDRIFNDTVKQNEIFNKCVQAQLYDLIYNDLDTNVMTYGASGSGKTHTILGDTNSPGIIPRSLEYIFRQLKNSDVPTSSSWGGYMKQTSNDSVVELNREEYGIEYDNTMRVLNNFWKNDNERYLHAKTYKAMENRISNEYDTLKSCSTSVEGEPINNYVYTVWISFFEIYNENVYDLLTFPNENDYPQLSSHHIQNRKNLKLIQDSKGNTHVKDLTSFLVKNGCDAYQLLQYGINKIKYASTLINQHSSRSHCIFKIKLLKTSTRLDQQQVTINNITFIDLAGSERIKDTLNKGERLKESNNINTSLHVLNRCLKLINDKQQHLHYNKNIVIPYRQSKLTQIFKRALSGKELITMIVNITPKLQMFDTTQHVLQFSSIAKNIIIINNTKRLSKFTQYISNKESETKSESIISNGTNNDEHEQQIELLLNENCKLKDLLQQQERIFEHRIQAEREEVVNAYNEILNDNEKQWEKRLQNVTQRFKQRDNINCSTITINSSIEESSGEDTDDEEQVQTVKHNNKRSRIDCIEENPENDELKRTRLSEENDEHEQMPRNDEQTALIKKLYDEVKYYKEIITDAKRDYELLKSEHDNLKQKYVEVYDQHLQCINNDDIVYDLSNDDEEESDSDNVSDILNSRDGDNNDDKSASINFSDF